MECVVLKPFHLGRRGRVEPSPDPANPMIVDLTIEQYDRFAPLGCVCTRVEHETCAEAEAEARAFELEAAKTAEVERVRMVGEARARADKARAEAEEAERVEETKPSKPSRKRS